MIFALFKILVFKVFHYASFKIIQVVKCNLILSSLAKAKIINLDELARVKIKFIWKLWSKE